jgi:hypothetical protein
MPGEYLLNLEGWLAGRRPTPSGAVSISRLDAAARDIAIFGVPGPTDDRLRLNGLNPDLAELAGRHGVEPHDSRTMRSQWSCTCRGGTSRR